jgi:hypothetical protein
MLYCLLLYYCDSCPLETFFSLFHSYLFYMLPLSLFHLPKPLLIVLLSSSKAFSVQVLLADIYNLTYNLSYFGGRGQEDQGLRPAWTRPHLQMNGAKRTGGVTQMIEQLFAST